MSLPRDVLLRSLKNRKTRSLQEGSHMAKELWRLHIASEVILLRASLTYLLDSQWCLQESQEQDRTGDRQSSLLSWHSDQMWWVETGWKVELPDRMEETTEGRSGSKTPPKINLFWALFSVCGTDVQAPRTTKNLITVCLWWCDCIRSRQRCAPPCSSQTELSGCTSLTWLAQHALAGKQLNSFPEDNLQATPKAQWGRCWQPTDLVWLMLGVNGSKWCGHYSAPARGDLNRHLCSTNTKHLCGEASEHGQTVKQSLF